MKRYVTVGTLPLLGLWHLALATAFLVLLTAPGCVRPQPVQGHGEAKYFLESARMLLAPTPFKTIYLEVDSVEGAEASPETLEALAGFLRETCHKPVLVVRKKPIPAADVGKLPPHLIALQHMVGPSSTDPNDTPAYVYVLLCRGSGAWERAGHVRWDYPCGIFLDVASAAISGQAQIRFGLKHEAGHMLSLCSNTAHGDGIHCNDQSCLMYHAFSISRNFLGFQRGDLCEVCQCDLAELRRTVQPSNLVFKGPFLVRRERGYFVARLPGAVHVEIGDPDKFDWQDILSLLRSQLSEMKAKHPDAYALLLSRPDAVLQVIKCDVETKQDYLRTQEALSAASEDRDPTVREMARSRHAELDKQFGH